MISFYFPYSSIFPHNVITWWLNNDQVCSSFAKINQLFIYWKQRKYRKCLKDLTFLLTNSFQLKMTLSVSLLPKPLWPLISNLSDLWSLISLISLISQISDLSDLTSLFLKEFLLHKNNTYQHFKSNINWIISSVYLVSNLSLVYPTIYKHSLSCYHNPRPALYLCSKKSELD